MRCAWPRKESWSSAFSLLKFSTICSIASIHPDSSSRSAVALHSSVFLRHASSTDRINAETCTVKICAQTRRTPSCSLSLKAIRAGGISSPAHASVLCCNCLVYRSESSVASAWRLKVTADLQAPTKPPTIRRSRFLLIVRTPRNKPSRTDACIFVAISCKTLKLLSNRCSRHATSVNCNSRTSWLRSNRESTSKHRERSERAFTRVSSENAHR
mmetsp:Transcript_36572/g.97485  ORF Transcript_36572/g.97485 Transcript_36572/m.97485 type:complete len:214 (-) Transcript_36572:1442-2083(-)